MYLKKSHIFIVVFMALLGCENSSTPVGPDQNSGSVQGTWLGKMDASEILVTLIEGEFENSATITGSASIGEADHAAAFLVMSGTRAKNDSVIFALYDPSLQGPQDFLLSATVSHDTLSGVFQQFQGNERVSRGTWFAKRVP